MGFGRKAIGLHLGVSDVEKVYVEPASGNEDPLLLYWNKIPATSKMKRWSEETEGEVR